MAGFLHIALREEAETSDKAVWKGFPGLVGLFQGRCGMAYGRLMYLLLIVGLVLITSIWLTDYTPSGLLLWLPVVLGLIWLQVFLLLGGAERSTLRRARTVLWLASVASSAVLVGLWVGGLGASLQAYILAAACCGLWTGGALALCVLLRPFAKTDSKSFFLLVADSAELELSLAAEVTRVYGVECAPASARPQATETGEEPMAYLPGVASPEKLTLLSRQAQARGLLMPLGDLLERLTGKAALLHLPEGWIARIGWQRPPSDVVMTLKHLLDKLASLALLICSLPLMVACMLAILLEDGRPIFYSQRRSGERGKVFTMWKLRTMVKDAEQHTGAVWASHGDRRVTRTGRILRATGLDEIPQLWNILRGEMSLVGPRPERPELVEQLAEQVPVYRARLAVRPGLLGWAQLHRGGDTCLADVIDKLRYDLYYLNHLSFWLDARVVLGTLRMIVLQRKPSAGVEQTV